MNSKCLLLTHQFIRNDKEACWKRSSFDICVQHYKKYNPDTYIIITGHGQELFKETIAAADHVYWPSTILPGEIDKGHPKLVTAGLEHARDAGFKHVCKSRLDSIVIPDVVGYCDEVLRDSGKVMLNSNYAAHAYLLWDLFMYSPTEVMLNLFDPSTWSVPWDNSGMGPVAKNYVERVCDETLKFPFDKEFWEEIVHRNTVFLTPHELKWIDFRRWHNQLLAQGHRIIQNDLPDYAKYPFDCGNLIYK